MTIIALSEVAEVISGAGFPTEYQGHSDGDVPFAKVGDISKAKRREGTTISSAEHYVSFEVCKKLNAKIFPEGTIVFAKIGEAIRNGNKVMAARPMIFDNNVMGIVPRKDKIFPRYLYRYVDSLDLFSLANSTTVPSIRKTDMEALEVWLPPLVEQKRIAAILDQADELRRKRQRALNRLNQLRQAIFSEMFGDPVANPFGFPVRRLSELGVLDRGISKHRPRNDPALLNGDHPLIQTGDVANADGYIRHFSNTYSDLGLRQSRKWPVGTLCITIAANIGKTAILGIEACFPDSVVGFTPNEATNAEYVQNWMERIQKRLEEIAPQSAQKNINLAILRELPIPVPPIEIQEIFAGRVQTIEVQKQKLRSAEVQNGMLFSSLQNFAFRGEL